MPSTSRVIGPDEPAHAGQRHYTRGFLKIYDPLVLGLFTRIWRCPTARVRAHYQQHIRRRHLDVGPGTGYFLDRVQLPDRPEVTLLDPNVHVLAHASRRLSELAPTTVEADILAPLPDLGPFGSVALNFVLHCLPGTMADASPAIDNAASVLDADGVLFGATILGEPELHTALSRSALRANNRRGIFDNLGDTEAGLTAALTRSFQQVQVEVLGSAAIFSAHGPRREGPGGPQEEDRGVP